MYLKSLQLKGFKSFAEQAQLELEPGVTVVVGPNGSGKSNVVDAIGWVLGAQRPSAVRSQKMDDVIFAGASKRSALGRAEVALTIDNTSGILPIDFTEVTISRTLFRSGESEYRINGAHVRLLEIQELLSDSGVGKQQHVIVSQGQIDAVLNAKPEERRLIIEEAAGVLKFRRRKEKSERRLESTEANLLRIQDLLREVKRSLRPLERQADAARRYEDVKAELLHLNIYTHGKDFARQKTLLADSKRLATELAEKEHECKAALSSLDARVAAKESELSAMGGFDFGDSLVRYETLHERAVGLKNLLDERSRGIERERTAFVDQAVVSSLEEERSKRAAELAALSGENSDVVQRTKTVRDAENELLKMREQFDNEFDDAALPINEAAELRTRINALATTLERTQQDVSRTARQIEKVTAKRNKIARHIESNSAAKSELAITVANQKSSLADATEYETATEEYVASVTASAHAQDVELERWSARRDALQMALDDARSSAGFEKLASVDGVLGTLLELVEVRQGYEHVFEAAAGEALNAVIVENPRAAQACLDQLHDAEISGAVLALGLDHGQREPLSFGYPIRSLVEPMQNGVGALLDSLLDGCVVVDGSYKEAAELAERYQHGCIVTMDGSRFTSHGWRVGISSSGVTGSALEEAERFVESSATAASVAHGTQRDAVEAHEAAVRTQRELQRRYDADTAKLVALTTSLDRDEPALSELDAEAALLNTRAEELAEQRDAEQLEHEDMSTQLPALAERESELESISQRKMTTRQRIEARGNEVNSMRTELEVLVNSIDERKRYLGERIAELETRLQRNAQAAAEAEERRLELDARAEAIETMSTFVRVRTSELDEVLARMRELRQSQSDRMRVQSNELEALRAERTSHEKTLSEIRERMSRQTGEDAGIVARIEVITEKLRGDFDTEPNVAATVDAPELPEATTPQARITELDREIRLMGPINPLALTEFEELSERHEFLNSQLEDIRHTRKELNKVIRQIDEEIVRVFASAFADVSENFTQLFETLFPGGNGSLSLVDPSDLLNTGVEISARPSGKNVRKLSLLSGGERSLTALAYLFAVFRSRPSPFYVMDEVEAALDDVNLHRFLQLIAEFRSTAQLIIVSHQKRTMEAADVLYGVSMEPGGSSKVLSEKVRS